MKIDTGNVAIITGASRGVGVLIARAFARRGVSLVLAARSVNALHAVADELREHNVKVLALPTDLTEEESLKKLIQQTLDGFGRIDVLVNNAGYEYALPFDQTEFTDINNMIALNLRAPIMLSRLVLPEMLSAGRGHIVNIASLAGVLASPYEELYCATKHGLVGFTRSLRLSAQDKGWPVSASVICPGFLEGAGMYESMKSNYSVTAPSLLGTTSAEKVASIVLHSIEKNIPEALMMKASPRFTLTAQALAPRWFELITHKFNVAKIFREVADAHLEERKIVNETSNSTK